MGYIKYNASRVGYTLKTESHFLKLKIRQKSQCRRVEKP